MLTVFSDFMSCFDRMRNSNRFNVIHQTSGRTVVILEAKHGGFAHFFFDKHGTFEKMEVVE